MTLPTLASGEFGGASEPREFLRFARFAMYRSPSCPCVGLTPARRSLAGKISTHVMRAAHALCNRHGLQHSKMPNLRRNRLNLTCLRTKTGPQSG